jgi:hypothetical protein
MASQQPSGLPGQRRHPAARARATTATLSVLGFVVAGVGLAAANGGRTQAAASSTQATTAIQPASSSNSGDNSFGDDYTPTYSGGSLAAVPSNNTYVAPPVTRSRGS